MCQRRASSGAPLLRDARLEAGLYNWILKTLKSPKCWVLKFFLERSLKFQILDSQSQQKIADLQSD